jgi:hypothetical protein
VRFLIDTGATSTILHPADTTEAQIRFDGRGEPRIQGRPEKRLGVGGTLSTIVVPSVLLFDHTDGRTELINVDLRVAYLTDTNRYLPSILGWDVLQFFELRLDWQFPRDRIELTLTAARRRRPRTPAGR